jgi:hypothetical protein
MKLPVFRNEHTGDASLDRIQGGVRDIIAYLGGLDADKRMTALEDAIESLSQRWSPASTGAALAVGASAGNFTSGIQFSVGRQVSCKGLRFYGVAAAAKVVKCKLYNAAGVLLASASIGISKNGTYEVSWPPVVLTPFALYRVCTWQTDGLNYYAFIAASANAPARPFYAGGAVVINNFALFLAGDTAPTSTAASEAYPVEPVLT